MLDYHHQDLQLITTILIKTDQIIHKIPMDTHVTHGSGCPIHADIQNMTEAIAVDAGLDADTQHFLQWLDCHGAAYPKILWPSYRTQSGLRGAVATAAIEPHEPMLSVPIDLMITPVHAVLDPYIGRELQESKDFLRGDLLLTVFLMYELLKVDKFHHLVLDAACNRTHGAGGDVDGQGGNRNRLYDHTRGDGDSTVLLDRIRSQLTVSSTDDEEDRNLDSRSGSWPTSSAVNVKAYTTEKSFWEPYLRILPDPDTVASWDDASLALLQSQHLISRVKARRSLLQNLYDKAVRGLHRKYPAKFPLSIYTHELFVFSYDTVSARAFGRRLPWSALVPLADCLNHANVPTKYDYNMPVSSSTSAPTAPSATASETASSVWPQPRIRISTIEESEGGNGLFRLFSTAQQRTEAGQEAFNSYGCRNNDNLLLDYGFALLDNEWEQTELLLSLWKRSWVHGFDSKSDADQDEDDKDDCGVGSSNEAGQDKALRSELLRIALAIGYCSFQHVTITWTDLPWEVLPYIRLLTMNVDDVHAFWASRDDDNLAPLPQSGRRQGRQQLPAMTDVDADVLLAAPSKLQPLFDPSSLTQELETWRLLRGILHSYLAHFHTTAAEDCLEFAQTRACVTGHSEPAAEASQAPSIWHRFAAVTYRLTKKQLVLRAIKTVTVLCEAVTELLRKREAASASSSTTAATATHESIREDFLAEWQAQLRSLCGSSASTPQLCGIDDYLRVLLREDLPLTRPQALSPLKEEEQISQQQVQRQTRRGGVSFDLSDDENDTRAVVTPVDR